MTKIQTIVEQLNKTTYRISALLLGKNNKGGCRMTWEGTKEGAIGRGEREHAFLKDSFPTAKDLGVELKLI